MTRPAATRRISWKHWTTAEVIRWEGDVALVEAPDGHRHCVRRADVTMTINGTQVTRTPPKECHCGC